MENQTRTCNNCGTPAKVVPAGVSKRTGKPYGAFVACESCGKNESLEPRRGNSRPLAQTPVETQNLPVNQPSTSDKNEGLARLQRIEVKMDALLKRSGLTEEEISFLQL